MEYYAARLASFNVVHLATKKRPSDPKGKRALKWPHKNPSPSELAQAGFYYHPTSSCPDNVTCYLCRSNLDGWEETDDPIEEHMSHSGDCGWAITVFAERAVEHGHRDLADPLSAGMLEARRMTFTPGWPHENKRGWLCKKEKMIEAGWYYCPTQESDDFVKCSYCSLSLDGWEPKDDPYEEHKRRSPDCMVFTLANETKARNPKGRKGSTSRASRLSTMSNFTVASDTISLNDTEAAFDESIISTSAAPKPGRKKGGKKGGRVKKPITRSRMVEKVNDEPTAASSFIEPEDDDYSVKVDHSPEMSRNTRKRKSTSSQAIDDKVVETGEDIISQAPPAKRRVTRSRNSVLTTQGRLEENLLGKGEDAEMKDAEMVVGHSKATLKKGKKGGKKRASSKSHRASTMSTASKASLRAGDPDDDEIEAALEFDLERPLTDEELYRNEAPPQKARRLTKTKPRSSKVKASVARTRKQTRTSTLPAEEKRSMLNQAADLSLAVGTEKAADSSFEADFLPDIQSSEPKGENKGAKKSENSKRSAKRKADQEDDKSLNGASLLHPSAEMPSSQQLPPKNQPRSRQASRQIPVRNTRASMVSISAPNSEPSELDNSMIGAQTLDDDSGHETDASMVTSKRGARQNTKKTKTDKQNKRGKKSQSVSHKIDGAVRPASNEIQTVKECSENQKITETIAVDADEQGAKQDDVPVKLKGKPKEVKPALKTRRGKKGASKAKAPGKELSPEPPFADAPPSPPVPEVQSTPAASAQSSDVENQPPSSRPSQLRPPLTNQPPFGSQTMLIPLAARTPTHSPSKNMFSKLQSKVPWTAVDLEQIFQETPNVDKENNPFAVGAGVNKQDLTSPERKMTVEQWIRLNAQRGEEKLRAECERLVGKFENEGMRALRTLESVVCAE